MDFQACSMIFWNYPSQLFFLEKRYEVEKKNMWYVAHFSKYYIYISLLDFLDFKSFR